MLEPLQILSICSFILSALHFMAWTIGHLNQIKRGVNLKIQIRNPNKEALNREVSILRHNYQKEIQAKETMKKILSDNMEVLGDHIVVEGLSTDEIIKMGETVLEVEELQ
ncbi:BM2 protein [Influenza B virus (B/Lee/1940)]|uniref:Matrix protein 2 n=7 Tax=Influenza B virus TaxID=11520 RepID=I0B750_INBLE|nr:BM2 protein [Influenza B virus (B/Lee/1940)]AFH57977.1 BM2 protein [Influenza B virus (B/reassortant/NYMC BX-43(Lee/1940 x Hong Kong/259/2010))]AFH58361.1 BM2 protein [Influenza B virus (B/reassortant/NYMC BX-29(Lee/1940 x Fujian-Gulou/1272/2008))]AFH58515.1 BM2 protein [Influenza B virus (B/reassortant/NYMC BX-43A(Lee/1940 x Hong Kong/259/2010))]AFH58537.1 BM2 protein [Influenza B virus (B/reassortant/NYMC BX-38-1P-1(Lee/1940 x Panama/45/1990))]AFH58548.1 BM2 protein [Influenza B virus (B/